MGIETHHHDHPHAHNNYKLKVLLIIILTNLLTIFIFITPFSSKKPRDHSNSSEAQHAATSSLLISELHQRLNSTNLLVQALLIELARQQDNKQYYCKNVIKVLNDDEVAVSSSSGGSDELNVAVGPHKVPFGFSEKIGSDEIQMPIGAACLKFQEELNEFMAYEKGGECPVDHGLAERLMLKGCEPLPRRRCHPKSLPNYEDPKPLPESLWTTPPDTNTIWDPYNCKTYQCIIDQSKPYNSKDDGENSTKWLIDDGGLDFGINQVLATKPKGTVRIGLDINGGTANFAARMIERNITIITTTLDIDRPSSTFIASRGLIPLHMSITQRLPFFDNTLDIVHSGVNGIGTWMPESMLEFAVYDVFRVLRPGGLFWVDHFLCFRSEMKKTYLLFLGKVGFKKVRWRAGENLGNGGRRRKRNNEWYISALFGETKILIWYVHVYDIKGLDYFLWK